jgi:integrase
MHLTETAIKRLMRDAAAQGKQLDCRDPRCPGLELRVGKTGVCAWALRCRDATGRLRTFTLGRLPEMGLSEARTAAERTRQAVANGADPTAERRQALATASAPAAPVNTLASVIELYEQQQGRNLKSWAHSRKRVDRVFAALMARPVSELTASELQIAADQYHAQQSASFAVRTLRPVLRWAARRKYTPAELAAIYEPAKVRRRRRVLSRVELADLLPVLIAADRPHPALFHFLLLTLARREEAAGARWRDVDLDRKIWRIDDTKNDEPHDVPLSRQALDLLMRWKPHNPEPDALLFATAAGTRLGNWDRETKRIQQESGTSGWSRHDLRRTGATLLGEMSVLPDIVEAALNHVAIRSPLHATYNRSRYRPQVARALQRLADALDGIVAGNGQVVSISHRETAI